MRWTAEKLAIWHCTELPLAVARNCCNLVLALIRTHIKGGCCVFIVHPVYCFRDVQTLNDLLASCVGVMHFVVAPVALGMCVPRTQQQCSNTCEFHLARRDV